jgi:hypothetical protein
MFKKCLLSMTAVLLMSSAALACTNKENCRKKDYNKCCVKKCEPRKPSKKTYKVYKKSCKDTKKYSWVKYVFGWLD